MSRKKDADEITEGLGLDELGQLTRMEVQSVGDEGCPDTSRNRTPRH